jgi:Cof subfamily protein (haloacid dehalogenase superfamily)
MAKSDIRLVVVDIDGTISGESNDVSDPVRAALLQVLECGIQVGIATGRMYRSAEWFHHRIQASMPVSAYQGALIRHPQEQKTYQHWQLDRQIAQELITFLNDYPVIIHVYLEDQLYLKEETHLSQSYAERSRVSAKLLSELGSKLPGDPTKVLAMSEDPELIETLLVQVRHLFPPEKLYLTRSTSTFLEATHPIVNKGQAVRYLAEEILGLTADQVLTIGDSDNDLEMLAYAGVGVAMGNANARVKAQADWIAPSVEEDGVVSALEKFVLG